MIIYNKPKHCDTHLNIQSARWKFGEIEVGFTVLTQRKSTVQVEIFTKLLIPHPTSGEETFFSAWNSE